MALALKILYGRVSINSFRFFLDGDKVITKDDLPPLSRHDEEAYRPVAPRTVCLPENAFLNTIGESAFVLLRYVDGVVGEDPYAEVHGEDAWRIWVKGNSAEAADRDKKLNRPVSYLHCHCCTCFPHYELQVNEGCARVATR
jgi:hypothetical protein